MASAFDLTGKTAVVTGATRGIGQAMAIALAEAGADIVVVKGSSPDMPTIEAVRKLGRKCTSYTCNFGDKSSVAQLIPRVTTDHKIDILVNAAGILKRHDSDTFPQDVFDEIIQVNLSATFALCRDIGKYWIENGIKGKIINVASLMTFFGGVRIPAYSASKGGVGQLTKALSNEWASKGICVNAIAPGYIATDLNRDLHGNPDSPMYKSIIERIPAKRWGDPEDLKGPVVFLASKASDYVTGEVLTVDGGFCGR
ncbi:2-deoxy-D-gluconate 3-dehydrogenase, putative [Coccidioides posadasii C735 delta SOWgp]|uniref:2-deoxy-D-gluconate 3-dehydrogenase, putative n=1 Tax=Coccidioides posadasii (strain C735) TaxID=222929 RepID=C5PG88_COCP7|nr:2-deoxy-D-gluconate 3-dehydrogenase, putative [Coccidioides posadasii C735 delta SOWgp]EER23541.1 2-deoxy-D-gluconate 3-dehydrogenase, putative [Coccidioides posadasii C735 delta SOWgp]|eukprot:XP_003065686.1 2-deoxy-D-gluconate 3-dehydrogenase, putative [Coccidioides posadasii C735 delta SOWgp]